METFGRLVEAMTGIGRFNDLKIMRLGPDRAVLDGGTLGEIPLSAQEVPAGSSPGDVLKVFLYHDSDGRPMATTASPAAQVGEVGYLKIVSVNDAGAFLNWGLTKDLLMPWSEVKREQKRLIVEGRKILACVFLADDGRVAASSRLDDFLSDEADGFKQGDKVTVLIAETTDLGLRVIVNHRYWGLVHKNEVFGTRQRGQRLDGYVKAIRPDRKLNITLSPPGYAKVDAVAQGILKVLARRGGSMAVNDKTPPEEIYALFGISKKVFKLTIGALYKSRRIRVDEAGIHTVKTPEP
jgi:predicted RNA-binding protein (virulence factor B family)